MADILKIKDDNGKWQHVAAITGASAYQIAIEKGYIGTKEEWLASLKGDKGDTGNLLYATFNIDANSGQLEMMVPDGYSGVNFEINENGELEVIVNG